MKWIGQQIYDQVSRFRNDVYLESISSGTIASGGHLGLDSNNKIVKAVDGGGDITSVVAGTNLSGGATSGAATINLADASTSAKGAASFSSANFAASSGAITIKDGGVDLTAEVTGVLPSANMDADTAHLTTDQTFTGIKTFAAAIISDGDRTLTPSGVGAAIHVDQFDVTDGATSASATTSFFAHVIIENPRLFATNSSVTTTDASTLYIKGAPIAGTNQTITRAYALWVDSGDARFDGDIDVDGTLETDALTVGGTNILTGSLITTLGTISAGVWNGTDIGVEHGGTGVSTLGANAVLIGNGTSAITSSTNLTFDDTDLSLAGAGKMEFRGAGSYINSPDTNDLEIVAADITLDASGVIKLEGPVRPTGQIVLMRAAFKDDIGTAKHYIPLQSELEQTAATHEMNSFVAPFNGKVLKLMYRGSGNYSGATFTFTLEKIKKDGAFATSGNLSTLETITATGPTNNGTDPNMIIVDFVGGSGTNAFSAGDNIMIGIQSDTDVTGGSSKHFFTLVTEFDFSGLA